MPTKLPVFRAQPSEENTVSKWTEVEDLFHAEYWIPFRTKTHKPKSNLINGIEAFEVLAMDPGVRLAFRGLACPGHTATIAARPLR